MTTPGLKRKSYAGFSVFLVSCLCLTMIWPPLTEALVYPTDFKFIQVVNPLSGSNPRYPIPLPWPAQPLPGQSFYDVRFGTVLSRITQSPKFCQDYSRFDAFNRDQSMLLLTDITNSGALYRVYRTKLKPYDQPANLVRPVVVGEKNWADEFRWDPSDPRMLWGIRDFSIIRMNVETGGIAVIKDFYRDAAVGPIIRNLGNPLRITDMNEGESSRDKRFWVFALQNGANPNPDMDYAFIYLFTWDRVLNKVLGVIKLTPAESANLDWVGMSWRGNWVLIGGEPGAGARMGGLTMASKDFKTFHRIAGPTAHSDVGLDGVGREVIVMQNSETDYVDMIPIDLRSKPVHRVSDYDNNIVKRIVRLYYNWSSAIGLNSGIHISCNYPGYCVISTVMSPQIKEQNWLDRSIILVRLDSTVAPAVFLAKIHNTTSQYWEETHASITNNGRKIVWEDNWGKYVPEPSLPKLAVLELDMPPNWQNIFP